MDDVQTEIEALTRALDLHSLRILMAIDQAGSISGAARSLGYSQPTITQHVQRLESKLGAALVVRAARSAHLTPAGALLAEHAPRIDASLTAAATELSRLLGRRVGTVRLIGPPEAIGVILAPVSFWLDTHFPGLDVTVAEAPDSQQAVSAVQGGRADLAIVFDIIGPGSLRRGHRPAGTRSTFLFAEEIVAVTSAEVDTDGDRVAPGALSDEPWITGAGTCSDAVAAAITRPVTSRDATVTRTDAALALATCTRATVFVAESSLSGVDLPAGVRTFALEPPITRRASAVTLSDAVASPTISIALRGLVSHRPAPVGLDELVTARRRSDSHRARFPISTSLRFPISDEESASMPSLTSSRAVRAATAAVAGALVLSSCASPHPSKGVGADTGEQIPKITVALPGSLSNLYVGQESGILNYYVASIAQEGLVSLDDKGRVQPGLAERWSQPNPTTYVFDLREGVKFQDGTPLTPEDVVFSLEKARDETASPGFSGLLTSVDSIEKTGDEEVTIRLSKPDAAFAKNMSTAGTAFITSKAFWERNQGKVGTPSALLLGTGPYKVTEFVPDSHVSFVRADTWRGPAPAVQDIRINFVPDESTRLVAAQSGDLDMAFNVPLAQATQWEKLQTMRVDYVNDLSYVGLYFNPNIAPFDDPKVRETFAHALDRSAYVDKLLRGHGEVATAIMTPESLVSTMSEEQAQKDLATVPQWSFDTGAAKAALAASKHPGGFETEILTPNTGPQLGKAAQALAQQLGDLGIVLKVREVPIEEWLASLDASSDHGVGMMWYFSTSGDPGEVPNYLLGAGNPSGYNNPAITDLLDRANAESDPKVRIDLLLQAETLQARDAINVPLWWGQSATAFSDELGIRNDSPYTFVSSWPTQLYRAQPQ
ncbi:LysR family transcriptional regulator [Mycolicibacterium sp. CH28]|uniref:ABC transporter substrate-binding protein n=1 Tax=Mycolicibacterium sp. CH28 TaxID=2512237 RepID=UPI001080542A|nr:ABC transporter substrate-binding protein [Mycolicibacterium sp. CH28]TGD90597.1 LysR family transcriptional regulator [Mycolicibacterium sp. CH28]